MENNDAVRQAVLDHLAAKGMKMDVSLTSVKFNGDKADVAVEVSAQGVAGVKMPFQYQLELKDGKWAVVGRAGASQHGMGQAPSSGAGGAMPGMENPHGGTMAAPGAGGKMPAPEDLPPAGQKK